MNNLLTKTLAVIVSGILFASCSKVKTIQISSSSESTPTILPTYTNMLITPSPTNPPTIEPISTTIVTPFPTTSERATIEAFGSLCAGSKEILASEISPNGKWIVAECYWEDGKEESPLQVVSVDGSKEWKIYYNHYAKGGYDGDRHDVIMPYRWSNDGRFLYGVAGSRISGCCWIGGKYVLLVRLNLETGEQVDVLNGTNFGSHRPMSFTISENDRFLLFTPVTNQPYDFAVLDLLSWETQVVKLETQKPIDLEFAVMSAYEDIIVLPLFKHIEFNDFKVDSVALIDLKKNKQRLLISDLKEDEELYPIRWIDTEQVLISSANPDDWHSQSSAEYWLLNINTGQLEKVEKP